MKKKIKKRKQDNDKTISIKNIYEKIKVFKVMNKRKKTTTTTMAR